MGSFFVSPGEVLSSNRLVGMCRWMGSYWGCIVNSVTGVGTHIFEIFGDMIFLEGGVGGVLF